MFEGAHTFKKYSLSITLDSYLCKCYLSRFFHCRLRKILRCIHKHSDHQYFCNDAHSHHLIFHIRSHLNIYFDLVQNNKQLCLHLSTLTILAAMNHGYFISLSSFQPASQKIACYLVTKSKLLTALAMHAFLLTFATQVLFIYLKMRYEYSDIHKNILVRTICADFQCLVVFDCESCFDTFFALSMMKVL